MYPAKIIHRSTDWNLGTSTPFDAPPSGAKQLGVCASFLRHCASLPSLLASGLRSPYSPRKRFATSAEEY